MEKKVDSKCIKDLSVRLETLKMLEEKVRKTLQDTDIFFFSKQFSYFWSNASNRQTGLIKLKSFCLAKETARKRMDILLSGRKTFISFASDRELISRVHKKTKTKPESISIRITNKYLKNVHSLATRKMKIKVPLRVRMSIVKQWITYFIQGFLYTASSKLG